MTLRSPQESLRILALPAAIALTLGGCGGGEDVAQDAARQAAEKAVQEYSAKAPENIEEAVTQLAEAFNGEGVDTVSTELLRDMLPKTLAGLERTNLSASKNSAMGIKISSAEAEYAGADPDAYESMTVNISDIGSMQGMARMGLSWLNVEVYEENDDGFNRTTEYKGHKSMESFQDNGASAKGNKMVFVDDRVLIDISTVNLPFEKIEEVLATLPVDELAKLSEG
ncbi:MAG: hypothetical protein AAFU65_08660 [Pseudomonadota bacterium]